MSKSKPVLDGDASASPLSEVLTVPELAQLLRIGRNEAYAACRAGEIPGVLRIGGTIRVSRSAVDAWMKAGQGPARSRRTR